MRSYNVADVEPSIVQPGFMDIELYDNGRLCKVVRLPGDWPVKLGDVVQEFYLRDDTALAYRVNYDMCFDIIPQNLAHAQILMRGLPGILQGSLDTLRFKYAMIKAMRARGGRPSLLGAKNFWRMTRQQSR